MGETTPPPFTPGRWEIDRLGVCVRLPIGTRGQQIRRIARTVATTGYRDAALDAENTRNAHLISVAACRRSTRPIKAMVLSVVGHLNCGVMTCATASPEFLIEESALFAADEAIRRADGR